MPASIKWIKGILIFRIGLIAVVTGILFYDLFFGAEGTFSQVFSNLFWTNMGLDDPYTDKPYTMGHIIGTFLLPFGLAFLEYKSIRKRQKRSFYVFFAVDFLLALTNIGSLVMQFVVFLLSVSNSAKRYFNKDDLEPGNIMNMDPDILDYEKLKEK